MSQVIRTTNDIIINSLYLIGELGVGEAPDAFMLSTGIELINAGITGRPSGPEPLGFALVICRRICRGPSSPWP